MDKNYDIKKLIISIIQKISSQIDITKLDDGVDLIGDKMLDSLGFLTLATSIQEKLGIEIPFDEYAPEEFTIMGKLIEICEKQLDRHAP